MLSHLGLINNAYFYSKRCGITKDSTWVNIMPLFHTSGCGMVTLGCLNSSCRMVLISLFDANTVLNTLANFKADIILGVPTMILSLLEVQETHPRNIDNLKVVSCGGSNVDPDMVLRVKKAFGCKFSTLYGQTEYCPVITQHHLTDTIDDLCKTIGQPIDQTEVSIQSVEEKTILPIGKVGEICARGPSKMLQYYNNAEATNQTIDQDGWLHTGDLGMMDERGYIKISGRVKEMIIRGGENHFPAEIENVLRLHSQILDIAIVGMPDKKYGEIIVAFVKFRNKSLLSGELKKFSRQEMSPQKTPSIWIEVDQFPLTGSGKIQKFKLIENFKKGYYKEIV
jgi:fatty-acyl-CoA synthase